MDDASSHDTSPAERRRLRVRASILDAAEKVFAAEGSEGLSIRRLADEIDYSPAAIYKYFGSKEELVDELKEAFFAEILTHVDSARLSTGPYMERAKSCLRVYMETALNKPQHYMAAFSDVQGMVEIDEWEEVDHSQSNKHNAFAFLVSMVAEGQERGELRQDVSDVALAMSLWSALHGAATLIAHIPGFPETKPIESGLSRDAFLDLHTDILLRGAQPQ
ncbi:MAG: TetR/AcrR family transcriptional regulator [Pseudomonadota bacterium]